MITSEEQLEMDCVNVHECMVPLMRLLDHMDANNVNPPVPTVTIQTTTQACVSVVECRSKYVINGCSHFAEYQTRRGGRERE